MRPSKLVVAKRWESLDDLFYEGFQTILDPEVKLVRCYGRAPWYCKVLSWFGFPITWRVTYEFVIDPEPPASFMRSTKTRAQTAAILGVSRSLLNSWVDEPDFPKKTKTHGWDLDKITEWRKNHQL